MEKHLIESDPFPSVYMFQQWVGLLRVSQTRKKCGKEKLVSLAKLQKDLTSVQQRLSPVAHNPDMRKLCWIKKWTSTANNKCHPSYPADG